MDVLLDQPVIISYFGYINVVHDVLTERSVVAAWLKIIFILFLHVDMI